MTGAADLPDPGTIRIPADEARAFIAALNSLDESEHEAVADRLRGAVEAQKEARDIVLAVVDALKDAPKLAKLVVGALA